MRLLPASIAIAGVAVAIASCATTPDDGLSPRQRALRDTWEAHMKGEFADKDVAGTMATMVEPAHVNHVPTMTGGTGFPAISAFYAAHFIPKMPPDTKVTPISRTIGDTQIVDEMIFSFTHTVQMDWMLPGVAPTGKRVEIPLVAIIGFKDGKVQHEHIYWDQASVLVQLGLLDAAALPVAGADTARKVLDPSLPSNALIERSARATTRAGGDA
jgi:carboxymethylenebutenolidase